MFPERFSLSTIKALDILCYNYFPICHLHQSVSFLNAGPMSHSCLHQVTSTVTGIFIKDIYQEATMGLALSHKYNEQGSHNIRNENKHTHKKIIFFIGISTMKKLKQGNMTGRCGCELDEVPVVRAGLCEEVTFELREQKGASHV